MKKRGQISISFSYVATIIVIGCVILFGLLLFKTLHKAGNEAELVTFESSIRSDLESIASNYGDVNFKDYSFPPNIGEVVFVDLSANPKDSVSAWLSSNYPMIADKINDGIGDDVYLFDDKGNFLKSMDIGRLTIAGPGWIAYKNENGKFNVKLEGKGNEAQVGGDFVRTAEFVNGIADITVEEITGLILHLEQNPEVSDTKVELRVKQSAGEGILTDNIEVKTLNIDGSDYTGQITFQNSYIEIPVSKCSDAGLWGSIGKETCVNSDDKIAKYIITQIGP